MLCNMLRKKINNMEWISVEKYLPGDSIGLVIVRCINRDLDPFYFMAIYTYTGWEYFNESKDFNDNKDFKESIRITHWTYPDLVPEVDYFIDENGTVVK
jgi:hypothetical protein